MKKYLLLFYCLCSLPFVLSSCKGGITRGSGKEIAETRSVSSFNAISISVPLDVSITVREGAQQSVQLSGYENIIQQITTNTKDSTLDISMPDGWHFYTGKTVSAVITMPSITALTLTGSTHADLHGKITGSKFNMDISGTGKATIDSINVFDFSTSISGAGNIAVMAGNVAHATYDITGTGNIKSFPLRCAELTATISGAGNAYVNVHDLLYAHISGVGHIRYKGHPSVVSDVSGVGTVSDAN